jgi:hypothetical protein
MGIGSSPARQISKNEKLAYTGTAGSTAASPGCSEVLLIATTDAYVKFDGTATADGDGSQFLPANIPLQFMLPRPAAAISAIRSSVSGTLFVSWLL